MSLEPPLRSLLSLLRDDDQIISPDLLVVQYGSRRQERDIDLLVVQPHQPPQSTLTLGKLDVLILTWSDLVHLLPLWDTLIVDPLLTGEVLSGNPERWLALRAQLEASTRSPRCVGHAARRCLEELHSAAAIIYHWPATTHAALWAMRNLSFSISLASFARLYARQGARPTTFAGLRESGDLLFREFWEYSDSAKHSPLAKNDVETWVARWACRLVMGDNERCRL